jgi:hypothetical protein
MRNLQLSHLRCDVQAGSPVRVCKVGVCLTVLEECSHHVDPLRRDSNREWGTPLEVEIGSFGNLGDKKRDIAGVSLLLPAVTSLAKLIAFPIRDPHLTSADVLREFSPCLLLLFVSCFVCFVLFVVDVVVSFLFGCLLRPSLPQGITTLQT